jgi:tetratricopeptide (TPR) repeat protein
MSLNDFPLRLLPRPLPSRGVNALAKKSFLLWLFVALVVAVVPSSADEAPVVTGTTAATTSASATNEVETQMLRNFLLLQDQLRATQRAIEQTREQAQADARRSEELLAARLNLIEQTLNARRTQEIESLQQSTRTITTISFIVTGIGLLAVVFAGFVQVKAMTRLAEVSHQLRVALPPLQIGNGNSPALLAGREALDAANANLLGAVDRLQKRLEEMEAATVATQTTTNGHKQIVAPAMDPKVTTVLAKGQALLNLDQLEEALDQFDEALRLEPRNIEAWIKKGTALERLQRVDEAISAYDQAIAVDSSTATAYLFKAGVYNRQKKYAEALQCYEKALSAQQKVRGQAARTS